MLDRLRDALPDRPRAHWIAVLAWCAVCGWFAFVRGVRVPLVSAADLGFHELGHLIMYVLPINQILTAAMGSIMQCAVPLGLATYFWVWRRDPIGSLVCLAWASTNLQDASVYIADAPYQRLELIGGEHDWAFVLGQLHKLQDAHLIATVVRDSGLLVLLVAIAIAAFGLVRALAPGSRALSAPAANPGAATASRADDLFPMP